jgi:hypothetical protein
MAHIFPKEVQEAPPHDISGVAFPQRAASHIGKPPPSGIASRFDLSTTTSWPREPEPSQQRGTDLGITEAR